MQIVFVKYIVIFCLALFFGDYMNCDHIVLQANENDTQTYRTTACTSRCLFENETETLDTCHMSCSDQKKTNKLEPITEVGSAWNLKLLCRNDTNLVFRVTNKNNSEKLNNEIKNDENMPFMKNLVVLKIYRGIHAVQLTYLSNTSDINVDNLDPNTTYNISVAVVNGLNEVSFVTNGSEFSTLPTGYIPGKVRNITMEKFEPQPKNKSLLMASVTWEPAEDMNCYYDIVYYYEQGKTDLTIKSIILPEELYRTKIQNITTGSRINIGIRGIRNEDAGEMESKTFITPSCLNWTNNDLTVCAPESPIIINDGLKHLFDSMFSMNITWIKPNVEPDLYRIRILELDSNIMRAEVNVSKEKSFVLLTNITLTGDYQVFLTASSLGGSTTTNLKNTTRDFFKRKIETIFDKMELIIAVVIPIICLLVVVFLILVVCHRRAKVKRYQERCKYFEELEKKAPVDSSIDFIGKPDPIPPSIERLNLLQLELENKLFISDDKEIDRDDIVLLDEILGEGAFGLVRKGIVKFKDQTEQRVAVKMLKDNPFIEDIKEFRREIEVMKFVGAHPNIVGIIGHCTRNINEMLLLTEYCSHGNLLLYLRSEWHYRNKIFIGQPENEDSCYAPAFLNTLPENNFFNFNTSFIDKIAISYKNINDNKLIESEPINIQNNAFDSKTTQIIVNKTYGYSGLCTNSCKCQVTIIPNNNECLTPNIFDCENNNNNKIEIEDCRCRLEQLVSATEEDSNVPVLVENKSYYKFLASVKLDQLNGEKDAVKTDENHLTSEDLLRIAKQIATGMDFLSRNKVVHRDLAARNVLVCDNKNVKIADFGLSRDIYQENIYKKTGNGKLPIKWLALESMTHQVYTSQSDVWSYGILLYEIITLGGTPYPSISTSALLNRLKTGYRMEKPKTCSQALYDLMYSCWFTSANQRPTFQDICHTLDEFLLVPPDEKVIDLNNIENNKRSKSTSEESYLKPIK